MGARAEQKPVVTETDAGPVRRCALTRVRAPKPSLLRLVLDEEGRPVFDMMSKAPGRGVYVAPDREVVRRALSPAGLGRLFRGRARAPAPEEVDGQLEQLASRLRGRIADHIRLARRAGRLVWGVAEVESAAPSLALLILAEDLSARSSARLEALPCEHSVRLTYGTKDMLGGILGKTEVGVVGVRSSVFVERILWDGDRLRRLTNEGRGPEGPGPQDGANDSRDHGEETDL